MTYPYGPHEKPGLFRNGWEALLFVGVCLAGVFVVGVFLWAVFG